MPKSLNLPTSIHFECPHQAPIGRLVPQDMVTCGLRLDRGHGKDRPIKLPWTINEDDRACSAYPSPSIHREATDVFSFVLSAFEGG